MSKRVMIVDSSGTAFLLFEAALAHVKGLALQGADDGEQAGEMLTGLGEDDVLLLDIELPFLDLVEFLAFEPADDSSQPCPVVVLCSHADAAVIERGLALANRAVA